jgi:hypothetical protein
MKGSEHTQTTGSNDEVIWTYPRWKRHVPCEVKEDTVTEFEIELLREWLQTVHGEIKGYVEPSARHVECVIPVLLKFVNDREKAEFNWCWAGYKCMALAIHSWPFSYGAEYYHGSDLRTYLRLFHLINYKVEFRKSTPTATELSIPSLLRYRTDGQHRRLEYSIFKWRGERQWQS